MAEDLRRIAELSQFIAREVEQVKGAQFQWADWGEPIDDFADHDHCRFCMACVCASRTLHPERRAPTHEEGGHYRHAFRMLNSVGSAYWVCRSCFKRLRTLGQWTIVPGTHGPAGDEV